MAPKQSKLALKDKEVKVSKASKGKAQGKACAGAEEKNEKKDVSNFLGQLKNGANAGDSSKAQTLAYYNSLARFSSEKQAMLTRWKNDKTCKWFESYQEENTKKQSSKAMELSGFGTRCLAEQIIFLNQQLFMFMLVLSNVCIYVYVRV